MKTIVGWSQVDEEKPATDEQLFGDMSWTARLQGFCLFQVLGFFANCLSWLSLSVGNYSKYAVLMTLGSCMSLLSTTLLMGPRRQCQSMFDETRWGATMMYLGAMVCTVVAAFAFHSAVLSAFLCLLQYCALVWYSLSYVPYGREMLKSCLFGCGRMVVTV